ncbi:MAG: hypothetical protein IKI11_05635 [Neisseriaceae bacterium]|nr:hypothetical protein [Neisseriaceae bacterium]
MGNLLPTRLNQIFRQPEKLVYYDWLLCKPAVCWWVENPPYNISFSFRQPENRKA